ncbi:MAG TPA: polymer-forming cytoskeletal protein [Methanocorpusculum sp.]|nr:polymer-forming cytoskeletal protein [Methanocorpusculum sp.]HJJ50772.1 polymer-forming cytoskeletal protein [Methanocorpusculum sp.]
MKVLVKDKLHMAEAGSYFRGSVQIDGDFLVPPRTFFWKDLVVTGNLYLCPESHVAGNVTCNGAVICRDSVIEGELDSGSEQLTVCDNAKVRVIKSDGNVLLRPGIVSSEVRGVNILVMGKIQCAKLMGKNTRVVTN